MWSEFGRRPEENASLGTDHGAAGCAFVVGSKAKGEMVGEFPGLAQLDENDNVRVTSDFRAMYCSRRRHRLLFHKRRCSWAGSVRKASTCGRGPFTVAASTARPCPATGAAGCHPVASSLGSSNGAWQWTSTSAPTTGEPARPTTITTPLLPTCPKISSWPDLHKSGVSRGAR